MDTAANRRSVIALLILLLLAATGCGVADGGSSPGATTMPLATPTLGPLPAVAPPLPFPDNPDPTQCGIPVAWSGDDPAWITGVYEGELVQPVVYLYDTHARKQVVGQIPHGARVEIELSQSNPTLNYYRVHSVDLNPPQSGWVPAPFVSFEVVEPGAPTT